jgi:hypothetical protein
VERDDEHEDPRGVSNAQEKVIDDADRLRALKIPAGAIWLDRPYGTISPKTVARGLCGPVRRMHT